MVSQMLHAAARMRAECATRLALTVIVCTTASWSCRDAGDNAGYRLEDPPLERERALLQLAADDGEQAVDELSLALRSDPDEEMRETAVVRLGELGREEAIEPLATAAATDPGDHVRRRAREALGRIGGPRAARRLVGLWSAGDLTSDERIQNLAVSVALKRIGEEALPAVRDALDAEQTRIRREAARLLGDIGTAEDIPRLEEVAANAEYSVASDARRGLEELRTRLDE
ncbi:MAG: HEAT repeat domain-containing protein [Myxococcota bacterium]